MKKAKWVALIAAGSFSDSPLARIRQLSDRLGPVKATSFRLASRIANGLRAGHAVKDYREFDACRLILVAVPNDTVAPTVRGLLASPVSWRGKAVVLLSSSLSSGKLDELAACGASVGSISPIPGFDDRRYVVEGGKFAVRESRRLLETAGTRAIVLDPQLKSFYLMALACTGSLFFASVAAAAECLRNAGMDPSALELILEKQLERSLRSYVRGGRRAYPASRIRPADADAPASSDQALVTYIDQACLLADRLLAGDESPFAAAAGRQV